MDKKLAHSLESPMIPLRYGVVLTGGIACGKSSVSALLREKGYEVICADTIAHKVLDEQACAIARAFGESVRTKSVENTENVLLNKSENTKKQSHTINRKALGEIVFNDSKKREQLESIMHPHIHAEILSQAYVCEKRANDTNKKKPYFLDIPLFFESGGLERYPVGFVVCISTSVELQIARLYQRNALTREQALQRIHAQMPLEQKRAASDFVIENTGSFAALESALESMFVALHSHIADATSVSG